MYKIQKNIPIPAKKPQGRKQVYPFARMEVGDSFVVPLSKSKSLASSINKYAKSLGMKFTRRVLGKEVRVWRIQ